MNFSTIWTQIKTIAGKVETAVGTAVTKLASADAVVDKAAPMVETVTGLISPSAAQAEKAVVDILDTVEAAIAAAGTAASGGVTVSLPAELVAAFNGAKAKIEADLAALGIKV